MKFNDIVDAMSHAGEFVRVKNNEMKELFSSMRQLNLVPPNSLHPFIAGYWATAALEIQDDPAQQLEMGTLLNRLLRGAFGKVYAEMPLEVVMTVAAELVLQWPNFWRKRSALKCPGKQIAALN